MTGTPVRKATSIASWTLSLSGNASRAGIPIGSNPERTLSIPFTYRQMNAAPSKMPSAACGCTQLPLVALLVKARSA